MPAIRRGLERRLGSIVAHRDEAKKRIAHHFDRVLPEYGRLLTNSYSSTVTWVLKELKKRGREFEIVVMESRPLCEGSRTAEELTKAKIPTSLVADAAVGEFVKDCDMGVVGADTVFRDGSTLNKIGTYPLALCCKAARIPFYVLTDSSKLSIESSSGFVPQRKSPEELFKGAPKGLLIENIYFDLTPPKYITAIITESGSFPPRRVGALVAKRHTIKLT